MAVSRGQIYNMALGECPADRIDSPDDGSFEAETCNTHYQPALDLLLEDHDWDFAIRRVALAQVTNDRVDEWGFAYAVPGDMARPRFILPYTSTAAVDLGLVVTPTKWWMGRLNSYEGTVDYRLANGLIYTSIDSAMFEYVSSNPGEQSFTAKFARALSVELAARIVMPLTKNSRRQVELLKAAEITRERAKAADMNRDPESPRDFISEVQAARMGYGVV